MKFLPLLLLAMASMASASFSKRSYAEQLPTNEDTYPSGGEEDYQGDMPSDNGYSGSGVQPSSDEKPCDSKHGPCRHRAYKQEQPASQYATPTTTTSCTTGNVLPTAVQRTPNGVEANSNVRPTCTTETVTKTQEKIVPTTIVNTQTKVVEKPVTEYRTNTRTVEHVATVTQPVYKTETATVTTTICETKTAYKTVEHTVVSTTTYRETHTAVSTVEHVKYQTATVTKTEKQKEYVTTTVTQTISPSPAGQLPFSQEKTPAPAPAYGYAPAAAAPDHEKKKPYSAYGGYPSGGEMPSNDNGY